MEHYPNFILSVEEAANYFHIGEAKLRRIIANDKDADFIIWNGTRPQIKRRIFENYIEKVHCI